jgi:hypothetical protein
MSERSCSEGREEDAPPCEALLVFLVKVLSSPVGDQGGGGRCTRALTHRRVIRFSNVRSQIEKDERNVQHTDPRT